MNQPSTIHDSPSPVFAKHLWRALAIMWGASILFSGIGGSLRSASSSADDLRTIHDQRTGKPVKEALGNGTVYEFRSKASNVNFWKTDQVLDGVWMESKDKRTLIWISTASGVSASSTAPCPADVTGGGVGPCPPTNGTVCTIVQDFSIAQDSQDELQAGSITAPTNGTLVAASAVITVTATKGTDTDKASQYCQEGGPLPPGTPAIVRPSDPVTLTWSDGGAGGSFSPASATDVDYSGTYTAPSTWPDPIPDTITLTATYNDASNVDDPSVLRSILLSVVASKVVSVTPCEADRAIELHALPTGATGHLTIEVETNTGVRKTVYNNLTHVGGRGQRPQLDFSQLPQNGDAIINPAEVFNIAIIRVSWDVGGIPAGALPFPFSFTSLGRCNITHYFTPVNSAYLAADPNPVIVRMKVGNQIFQVHRDWAEDCRVPGGEGQGLLTPTSTTFYTTQPAPLQNPNFDYIGHPHPSDGFCNGAVILQENRSVARKTAGGVSAYFLCGDLVMILGVNGTLQTKCHKVEDNGLATEHLDKFNGRGNRTKRLGAPGIKRVLRNR